MPERESSMDEGFFAFNYQGVLGFGLGCLCLEKGRVAGFDFLRGHYDGVYEPSQNGTYKMDICVIYPAGTTLVSGVKAPDVPITLSGHLPAKFWTGIPFLFEGVGGVVQLSMVWMRPLGFADPVPPAAQTAGSLSPGN